MREGEVRTQETLETFRARLERAETRPPAPAGVDQVAIRIGEIQDRTSAAMSALHEAFGGLDQRLANLEAGTGEGVENRLREMSFRLGERLDAAREEMTRDLSETAGRRIGELERSVAELSEKVRRVERQSAGLREAGLDRSVQTPEAPASTERHPAEEAERIAAPLIRRDEQYLATGHIPFPLVGGQITSTGVPSTSMRGEMPRPGASDAVMRPFLRCGAPSAIVTVP